MTLMPRFFVPLVAAGAAVLAAAVAQTQQRNFCSLFTTTEAAKLLGTPAWC